jgi:hypothetical protein
MVRTKDDVFDSRESEMTRTPEAAPDRRDLEPTVPRSRSVALQLIATVALALSTAVAATAVSIGIARAETLGARVDGEIAPLAIALLIGLFLSAMGGLTAIMADGRRAGPSRS